MSDVMIDKGVPVAAARQPQPDEWREVEARFRDAKATYDALPDDAPEHVEDEHASAYNEARRNFIAAPTPHLDALLAKMTCVLTLDGRPTSKDNGVLIRDAQRLARMARATLGRAVP